MFRFEAPTDGLCINSLRLALLNYITSKESNSGFIIRVNDSTKIDNIDEIIGDTKEILKKFAINEDIVIHKSEKLKIYQEFAYKLVKNKKAYPCFCDTNGCCGCKELSSKDIENYKLTNRKFAIKISNQEYSCFKIIKLDGDATDTFSAAIDDMSMAVTKIIISNKDSLDIDNQKYIHKLLDYKNSINYIFIPDIKIDKTFTIKWLLAQGFLPDAIINYILSSKDSDIFYLPEAIKKDNILDIAAKESIFDLESLKNLNRKHLREIDSKRLSMVFGFADQDIGDLLKLYLDEASTINELAVKLKATFSPKECNRELDNLVNIIKKAPIIAEYSEFREYIKDRVDIEEKKLDAALRYLLTGLHDSVNLDKIYKLIKSYILEVIKCR